MLMAIKNSGSGDGLPLFSLYPNTKEIHLHILFNLFNREWKSLNSHHLSTLCGMNTNVRYHDRTRGKNQRKFVIVTQMDVSCETDMHLNV